MAECAWLQFGSLRGMEIGHRGFESGAAEIVRIFDRGVRIVGRAALPYGLEISGAAPNRARQLHCCEREITYIDGNNEEARVLRIAT